MMLEVLGRWSARGEGRWEGRSEPDAEGMRMQHTAGVRVLGNCTRAQSSTAGQKMKEVLRRWSARTGGTGGGGFRRWGGNQMCLE